MIDKFIRYIQTEKRYSLHTVNAYRRDLEQFFYYVKTQYESDDLLSVDDFMIRSFIIELKDKTLENRTINRKLSTLRAFYRFCLREKLIEKMPITGVKSMKQSKEIAKFVSEQEMEAFSFPSTLFFLSFH